MCLVWFKSSIEEENLLDGDDLNSLSCNAANGHFSLIKIHSNAIGDTNFDDRAFKLQTDIPQAMANVTNAVVL